MPFDINFLAVLAATIATMIIGFLWYGPIFGKKWAGLMGYDMSDPQKKAEMKKQMMPAIAVSAVCAFVMAGILAGFFNFFGTTSPTRIFGTVFWLWLGFVTTVQLTMTMYGNKPKVLYLIDTSYWLVVLTAQAAIIGFWPW